MLRKIILPLVVVFSLLAVILIVAIILFKPFHFHSGDSRLQVKNNSTYAISVEFFTDTIFEDIIVIYSPAYFNSTNTDKNLIVNEPAYYISTRILPEEIRIKHTLETWSQFIERSVNNKLNVFIFATDTIEKYGGFEHIVTHKLYERYEFDEKELEKMNWTIEYPRLATSATR